QPLSDSAFYAVSARVDADGPPDLAGFEPLGRVDAGGMGVVWRVREVQFQRVLAVKVMRSKAKDDAENVRRFEREAQVTGQLAHPYTVPVHAMGRLPDGRPYYTMKLVEGQTLAALLRNRERLNDGLWRLVQILRQ